MIKKLILGILLLTSIAFSNEKLKFYIGNSENNIKIYVKKDKEKPTFIKYIVQPGDTLSLLAKRYNTTIKKIVSTNKIKNINLIVINQNILIEDSSK